MKITYRVHAIQRMFERGISEAEVGRVLSEGIVITVYEPNPALWEPGFKRRRP